MSQNLFTKKKVFKSLIHDVSIRQAVIRLPNKKKRKNGWNNMTQAKVEEKKIELICGF